MQKQLQISNNTTHMKKQTFSNINNNLLTNHKKSNSVDAINEKRRKRRESHNAVERRRRDHINEKISELSSLLPDFSPAPGHATTDPSSTSSKPNKGTILKRSVEYIRHMQLFAARQMDRTLELEQVLMRICLERGINESELGLSSPLGTTIQLPLFRDAPGGEDMASVDE